MEHFSRGSDGVMLWINNLGQAAALSLLYPLEDIRVSPTNKKLAQFGFSDDEGVRGAADAYWAGLLQVDALSFYTEVSKLRTRMYQVIPLSNNNKQ